MAQGSARASLGQRRFRSIWKMSRQISGNRIWDRVGLEEPQVVGETVGRCEGLPLSEQGHRGRLSG